MSDTYDYEPSPPDHDTDKPVAIKNINIVHETEKAILVAIKESEGITVSHWFPISQTFKLVRSQEPWQSEIHVSHWIAKKKGLA